MSTETPSTLQALLKAERAVFPFRSQLSLDPLIRFWTQVADSASARGPVARVVAEAVAEVPAAEAAPVEEAAPAGRTRRRATRRVSAPAGEPKAAEVVEETVPAVAEALHFSFYEKEPLEQQLLDYLRRKQILLVMDNFEHLRDAAPVLVELLSQAPHLTLTNHMAFPAAIVVSKRWWEARSDAERSLAWYQEILGLHVQDISRHPDGRLRGAFTGRRAAVVSAVTFAVVVLFEDVRRGRALGVTFPLPEPGSIDVFATALAVVAFVALWRYR